MSNSDVVRLSVPATFADVRTIDAAVVAALERAQGIDEGVVRSVELAIHEICVNIVEHAYGEGPRGQIEVAIGLTRALPYSLVVELRDRGRPFESSSVATPDLDVPHDGGYGMFLARSLLDEVRYERRRGRNIWRLRKSL